MQWALKGFPENQVIAENKKINGKREGLKAHKAELQDSIKKSHDAIINVPQLEAFIKLMQDTLPTFDFKGKRLALAYLGIKVWLGKEAIEITGFVPKNTVIALQPQSA
ncbi:MAG: hypothetical protein V1823_02330 [Chloroflexota bacterium]